jgi:HEPN domain-containing protein
MAADPPREDPRVIAAYLDDVDLDLDAARRLVADPPNRLAAFHLQQAAEKLVKAVRLFRGLRVTADHNIAILLEELSPEDAWRAKLAVLEPLSSYATAYRYPSPTGKRKGGPSHDEVSVWLKTIAGMSAEARALVAASGPGSRGR